MKDHLTLNVIDTDTKMLTEALGISDSRGNELVLALRKNIIEINGHNYLKGLVETSKICEHQNELAYMCYIAGQMVVQDQERQRPNLLSMLMGRNQNDD